MGAGDEQAGDKADVERYEELRAHALGGEPSGWRLGLALFQGRGTAAWLRASHGVAPVPLGHCPTPGAPADEDAIVGVLATMALAVAGG